MSALLSIIHGQPEDNGKQALSFTENIDIKMCILHLTQKIFDNCHGKSQDQDSEPIV